MGKINAFEDLEVYKLAIEISQKVWIIYKHLDKQYRYHIGNQILNSSDSVGGNIAEGFGRFHFRDSLKFYYNARGSLFETKHWIILLHKRELINQEESKEILMKINKLGIKLNNFINYMKQKVQTHHQ